MPPEIQKCAAATNLSVLRKCAALTYESGDSEAARVATGLQLPQHVGNLLLDFQRQGLEIGRPEVPAISARDRHHGQAFHNKCAAGVLTLGTLDGKGLVGVGHLGLGLSLRKRIVIQYDDHEQCMFQTAKTKRKAERPERSTRENPIDEPCNTFASR